MLQFHNIEDKRPVLANKIELKTQKNQLGHKMFINEQLPDQLNEKRRHLQFFQS